MSTALTTYSRPTWPSLLGRSVFDDVLENFFTDFPKLHRESVQGYPVADIYRDEEGSTVMEFALAGFTREELSICVQPDKRSITVAAASGSDADDASSRRIARRSFQKTYVNYDDNLNLTEARASFENGLLTVTVPARPEDQPVTITIQ